MSRFVRRPWGWWLVLLDRPHFKLKLLRFNAAGALSLQYHNHRSELWLFLRGEGHFRRDSNYFEAKNGDVVKVSEGEKHRYVALTPTVVLEVQYGTKCIEEDIVRLI